LKRRTTVRTSMSRWTCRSTDSITAERSPQCGQAPGGGTSITRSAGVGSGIARNAGGVP